MAPVAGKPFLFYVINYLRMQGIERFVFSLGYKHEIIEEYLAAHFPTMKYECSVENEPLGTGGAIKLASKLATAADVLIANGDTFFSVNVEDLFSFHREHNAECTLSLKPMQRFDRYGVVSCNADGLIETFNEKKYYEQGLINGGMYLLNLGKFHSRNLPDKFSFEKDYLESYSAEHVIYGVVQDRYFIDIGIPEDYNLAQRDFRRPKLDLKNIDKDWTIFLDRDGVINLDKPGSYIFTKDEFVFYDGVPASFKIFRERFGRVIVTTNQRGVGRGLMSEADLAAIHEKMAGGVRQAGGRLDAIFYATSVHNDDLQRKPNTGMAIAASKQFPEIDFSRSIMVGNNLSDMEFGKNAGMYTVFLRTTQAGPPLPHESIDLAFDSLHDFAKAL
jgi:D-glycero-alpha-D-manno-heptose 1-phosphate guanylyltransferase